MALHKLVLDDFYDGSFCLIALHCRLEDYRLAYLLNKHLNLKLSRMAEDLDYKYLDASYSIYEWENKAQYVTWNLINNVCKREETMLQSSGSLFMEDHKTIKTHHLLPELKNVDFLIKLSCDAMHQHQQSCLKKLQGIPQIITSYSVDTDKLKSKEHLIF